MNASLVGHHEEIGPINMQHKQLEEVKNALKEEQEPEAVKETLAYQHEERQAVKGGVTYQH